MFNLRTAVLACGLAASILSGCGGGGGSSDSGSSGATTPPAVATAVDLPDGATVGASNWPDGDTTTGGQGAAVGGIACGLTGGSYHVHSQLSIYQNGRLLTLPAGIGAIGVSGTDGACKYPLHTNDGSGKIHVIAPAQTGYTLGQFFAIWGRTLSATEVAGLAGTVTAYVNDGGTLTAFTGNPGDIVLNDHRQIVLIVGTPPATVASYSWAELPALGSPPVPVVTETGIGQNHWPEGDTITGGRGQTVAGLTCGVMDETYHVHAHLSIFNNGVQLAVPSHVGLLQGPSPGCTYSTHTHDATGKLHIESTAPGSFTLGMFFQVWGRPLSTTTIADLVGTPVAIYINDGFDLYRYTGDPNAIELTSHRGITLQVGPAPATIPSYSWEGT